MGHQRLKVQRVAPRALFVCAGESGAAFERRVFPVQKKPPARVGEPSDASRRSHSDASFARTWVVRKEPHLQSAHHGDTNLGPARPRRTRGCPHRRAPSAGPPCVLGPSVRALWSSRGALCRAARLLLGCRWVERSRALRRAARRRHARARLGPQLLRGLRFL